MSGSLTLRKRKDGRWWLVGGAPEQHEFSEDWIVQSLLLGGIGTVSEGRIVLGLVNAEVVYRQVDKPEDDKRAVVLVELESFTERDAVYEPPAEEAT